MPLGREPGHVGPGFGQDNGGGDGADARYLIQVLRRRRERGQLRLDLFVDRCDVVCMLPETQRTWAEENMDSDVLVLGDHTGQVKKWFDDRPTPLVFLRPDRFVAGACLVQNAPPPKTVGWT